MIALGSLWLPRSFFCRERGWGSQLTCLHVLGVNDRAWDCISVLALYGLIRSVRRVLPQRGLGIGLEDQIGRLIVLVGEFLLLPRPTHLLLVRVMADYSLLEASVTPRRIAGTFQLAFPWILLTQMVKYSTASCLRHSSQAARLFRPSSPSPVEIWYRPGSSGTAPMAFTESLFKSATRGQVPHIMGSAIANGRRTEL